jgi:hemoglobin
MTSRRFALAAIATLALTFVSFAGGQLARADDTNMGKPADPNSLYRRLGGYDALAAVTDDFVARLATDKTEKRFFVGLNDASKARVRQHVVDLLCSATGGPCIYLGQDMKTAHHGLGITENDWQITVKLLTQTLDKFNVGQKERDDLFAILTKIKPDIVQPAKM